MSSFTAEHIASITGAKAFLRGPSSPFEHIHIDSRKITHGEATLFIALKTAHRDGHQFVRDAYKKGVRNFLLSSDQFLPEDANCILVSDTLKGLHTWAAAHRRKFSYPVIGITGSNGKTIVKEWLAALLEPKYKVVKSPMSFNSQIGVPLSILRMGPEHELAIIEVGISEKGKWKH